MILIGAFLLSQHHPMMVRFAPELENRFSDLIDEIINLIIPGNFSYFFTGINPAYNYRLTIYMDARGTGLSNAFGAGF